MSLGNNVSFLVCYFVISLFRHFTVIFFKQQVIQQEYLHYSIFDQCSHFLPPEGLT